MGVWEGNGSPDSLSIFIDLECGQALTLCRPPPSAPLQCWAYYRGQFCLLHASGSPYGAHAAPLLPCKVDVAETLQGVGVSHKAVPTWLWNWLQGGLPVAISITVQATDQMSACRPWPVCLMTSGAIQYGVPLIDLNPESAIASFFTRFSLDVGFSGLQVRGLGLREGGYIVMILMGNAMEDLKFRVDEG